MSSSTEISRSVAIVGRPNVGKSRLFNRLVGRRVSIVHDMPGVTRDLIVEEVRDGNYLLMDTGGIGLYTALTPRAIADAVEEQVGFAINAAHVVLLVVDVNEGCTPLDLEIAHRFRHFGKQVILVANKADNEARANNQGDFFGMNLGAPVLVSAEHGKGIPFLIAKIKEHLGPETTPATGSSTGKASQRIRLCLVGRPNVGKSSIGNKLLNAERLIVSEIAGTTRDPVRTRLDYAASDGTSWPFELIDTAGRRAATHQDALDFFSELRSDNALTSADVVFLVLEAESGVTRMDKQLAGKIATAGTGLVVVVNKWDIALRRFSREGDGVQGYANESEFRASYLDALRRELFFLPDSPVLFTSATLGLNIEELLAAARDVHGRRTGQLPTAKLNKTLHTLMERQPPRMVSGRRFKCYYAVQTGTKPVRIRLFCNSKERVETAYKRYLLAGLYEAFALAGVPVELEFIGKPKDPERQFFLDQQSPAVGAAPHQPARKKTSQKTSSQTGQKTTHYPRQKATRKTPGRTSHRPARKTSR
ncbi:MAG: ribosome biogenesis GTPase Der [Puniceicoccales bacterium]|jgi:GTP-binding protein|nr:ribosome biogenesis GTPase Der [Puniceicoccales bacterium]